MENQQIYHKNQLIWAKVHGYPWWPAIVRYFFVKSPKFLINKFKKVVERENIVNSSENLVKALENPDKSSIENNEKSSEKPINSLENHNILVNFIGHNSQ